MSPDNSLTVVYGGEVVVAATCNATTMGNFAAAVGVATADGVVVGVGVVAVVVVWV